MEGVTVGDIVTGIYKTGKYIGEVTEVRPMHFLVKIKAVLKHPQQGDLHNPNQVDVQLFHERRALAYNEQTNIPKKMVKIFEGDVPEYLVSLQAAVQRLKEELEQKDTPFAKQSLTLLHSLEIDYFKK